MNEDLRRIEYWVHRLVARPASWALLAAWLAARYLGRAAAGSVARLRRRWAESRQGT